MTNTLAKLCRHSTAMANISSRSNHLIFMKAVILLLTVNLGLSHAWRHVHDRGTLSFNKESSLFLPRGGDEQQQQQQQATVQHAPIHSQDIPKKIEDDENAWREALPEQLRKRRGALYKFLMPTGVPFSLQIKEDTSTGCGTNESNENLCEVYILGTAHVSKDSCEDVKLLMDHIKPDVLFIELCNQRMAILEDEPQLPDQITRIEENEKEKSVRTLTKEVMEHNPGMSKAAAMSSVLLSKIQGDYASKLNVTIGGEFKEAFHMAKAQHTEYMSLVQTLRWQQSQGSVNEQLLQQAKASNGCSIVLGDRPVRLTLLRAWEALSFFGKMKLVAALAWSSFRQPSVEELREWIESIMNDPSNDILSKSIEELSYHFPAIKKTIIEERDVYMACKIVQTARIMGTGSAQDGMRRKIVAVVGAGHCPGMKSILTNEMENQGSLDAESALKKVVETKKHKVENESDLQLLITDVSSMEHVK